MASAAQAEPLQGNRMQETMIEHVHLRAGIGMYDPSTPLPHPGPG